MLKEAILRVDLGGGRLGWRRFRNPLREYRATSPGEVISVLTCVEADAERGEVCVGFVAYEAASAFDPNLATHPPTTPLAHFASFDSWEDLDALPVAPPARRLDWRPEVSDEAYRESVDRIRSLIEAGDTYQANYTFRLRAPGPVDSWSVFHAMARCPKTGFSAFLAFDDLVIACASPELFFEMDGTTLRSAPMKGTSRRGRFTAEDLELARALAASEKDRAENLMIADMVRNDLGRVATVGSVRVEELFRIERYATVHQMVTSVAAECDAPLPDIFRALFPPASMTGAPKRRTMEILRECEPSPRGVYSGCIGTVGPGRTARFGVAIRTAVGDLTHNEWEFGVGGGIVWDSTASNEAAEWRTKAAILSPQPTFDLLETIAWTPEDGYALLDLHLQRLQDSADYFDFRFDEDLVRLTLDHVVGEFGGTSQRVRLQVGSDGECKVDFSPLEGWPSSPSIALADRPIDESDRLMFHKTTRREPYGAAKGGHECDEVLLWNRNGEVTEGSYSNVVFQIDGRLFTPPLSCGLVPGVFRARMLSEGTLDEQVLGVDELGTVECLFLMNSVRGLSAACRWVVARGNQNA